MTSKYAAVFPRLKREEKPRDERLEEVKATLADLTPAQLATSYAEWRKMKSDIEDELKVANLELEAREQLLIKSEEDAAEGWGLYGAADNTLRRPNGDKIEIRDEIHVKCVDQDATRDWFEQQGLRRLLTVHPSTLASHVKNMLLCGDAEPPGTEAVVWRKVVFTPMEKK